ncbi:MAG: hypothetical protein PHP41_00440 [Bacilli bacterium]|nr:hypothetical protein [Bacilli bacterium]MDY0063802.1 hypothetical protein [Bacilli bacterium]
MNKKNFLNILLVLIIFIIFNLFLSVKASYYHNIEAFAFEPFGIENEDLVVTNNSVNIEIFQEGSQSNLTNTSLDNQFNDSILARVETTYQVNNNGIDTLEKLIIPIWSTSKQEYSNELIVNDVKKEIDNLKYGDIVDNIDLSFVDFNQMYNNSFYEDFLFSSTNKGKLLTFESTGDNYEVSISYNKGNRKVFFDNSISFEYEFNQENMILTFYEKEFEIFVIGGDVTINLNEDASVIEQVLTYNEYLEKVLEENDIEENLKLGLIAKKFYELLTSYNYYNFYYVDELIQSYNEYRMIFLEYDIQLLGNSNNEIIFTQTVPFYFSDWWNGNNSQYHFNYIVEPQKFWNNVEKFEFSVQTSISQSTIMCEDIDLVDGYYEISDIQSERLKQIHFFVEMPTTDEDDPSVFETDDPVFTVLIIMTAILIPSSILLGGIIFIIIIIRNANKKSKKT